MADTPALTAQQPPCLQQLAEDQRLGGTRVSRPIGLTVPRAAQSRGRAPGPRSRAAELDRDGRVI